MATQRHRWLTMPDSRAAKRSAKLVAYVRDQALADLAANEPAAFTSLVDKAKAALTAA